MIQVGDVVRCTRGRMSCITLHAQYLILRVLDLSVEIMDDYGNKKTYKKKYFKEIPHDLEATK